MKQYLPYLSLFLCVTVCSQNINITDSIYKASKPKMECTNRRSNKYSISSGSIKTYTLTNRKPLHLPLPYHNGKVQGIITIDILVDVNGVVLKATPERHNTTIFTTHLITKAKEAALKTKWNIDKEAPLKQLGRITYQYKLP